MYTNSVYIPIAYRYILIAYKYINISIAYRYIPIAYRHILIAYKYINIPIAYRHILIAYTIRYSYNTYRLLRVFTLIEFCIFQTLVLPRPLNV